MQPTRSIGTYAPKPTFSEPVQQSTSTSNPTRSIMTYPVKPSVVPSPPVVKQEQIVTGGAVKRGCGCGGRR